MDDTEALLKEPLAPQAPTPQPTLPTPEAVPVVRTAKQMAADNKTFDNMASWSAFTFFMALFVAVFTTFPCLGSPRWVSWGPWLTNAFVLVFTLRYAVMMCGRRGHQTWMNRAGFFLAYWSFMTWLMVMYTGLFYVAVRMYSGGEDLMTFLNMSLVLVKVSSVFALPLWAYLTIMFTFEDKAKKGVPVVADWAVYTVAVVVLISLVGVLAHIALDTTDPGFILFFETVLDPEPAMCTCTCPGGREFHIRA